jgi:hypothetical protein
MAAQQESEPLPARVKSSYQKLLSAATELNSASDRFSKLVAEIDATLKPLNIGIESFVQMGPGWSEAYTRGHHEVGYAKINGKWCIMLREVEETPSNPEEQYELWAFSDGPRRLRLKAIDYLPNLLEELAKKATGETKDINAKTTDLQQLVSALKESARQ